jgi:P pilus assembly chaperone PapD
VNGRGFLAASLPRLAALALITVAVLAPVRTHAQNVLIAPQAVVIDSRTRTGKLTLVNESDTPAEVAVSTLYGYPVTDSIGMMSLHVFDGVVPDTAPSAANWIQVFPRRLRLPPRARQTLRLLVSPPDSISAREYWARLVVAVRGSSVPVPAESSANISASLTLEVRSVLGVFYRNGKVRTGLTMAQLHARAKHDSVISRADLTRTGTAAFVGSLNGTVRDATGRVVGKGTLPLGVYYTLSPRLAMATGHLPPGKYTMTLEAVTARPDVASRLLIHAPSVTATTEIVIP